MWVVRGDWMGRSPLSETGKTEVPCHRRCCTIKILPCSKAMSAEYRLKFWSPSPVIVTSSYQWSINMLVSSCSLLWRIQTNFKAVWCSWQMRLVNREYFILICTWSHLWCIQMFMPDLHFLQDLWDWLLFVIYVISWSDFLQVLAHLSWAFLIVRLSVRL
jgi:hypothetical protein